MVLKSVSFINLLTFQIALRMTKNGKAGMNQTLKGNSGHWPALAENSCQKMVQENVQKENLTRYLDINFRQWEASEYFLADNRHKKKIYRPLNMNIKNTVFGIEENITLNLFA